MKTASWAWDTGLSWAVSTGLLDCECNPSISSIQCWDSVGCLQITWARNISPISHSTPPSRLHTLHRFLCWCWCSSACWMKAERTWQYFRPLAPCPHWERATPVWGRSERMRFLLPSNAPLIYFWPSAGRSLLPIFVSPWCSTEPISSSILQPWYDGCHKFWACWSLSSWRTSWHPRTLHCCDGKCTSYCITMTAADENLHSASQSLS